MSILKLVTHFGYITLSNYSLPFTVIYINVYIYADKNLRRLPIFSTLEKMTEQKQNGHIENNTEVTINELNDKTVEYNDYPEGGRGWFALVGSFLGLNTTNGMVQSFGVYELYYEKNYPHVSASQISLIGALQPFFIYVACIPSVAVVNSIGLRYSVLVGYFLMSLSFMMLSLTNDIWQVYLTQGVLYGCGAGLIFFASTVVLPEYFYKRRGLAMGIAASGSSFGGIVYPIMTQRLFEQVGFPWTNRIIGFLYIPLGIISFWALKPRYNKKREIIPDWRVLKSRRYLIINLATTIGIFGYFPAQFYIANYASKLDNVSDGVKDNILTIMNACGFLGRAGVSWLADQYGRVTLLTITMFLTGVCQLAFWLPARSDPLLIIFALTYGVFCSTYTALVPAILTQVFGIHNSHSRLSINFMSVSVGALAGPLISGTFINTNQKGIEGFDKLIAFTSSCIIAGSLILLYIRFSINRKLLAFV